MEHIEALYHFILAIFATVFYGYPGRSLTVIAVTGTSGKTTTSHLIYSILKMANKKVALISSVKAIIGGKEYDTGFHVTTPTTFAMQKFLRQAVNSGDSHIVIEASSHGIAQYRMLGTNVYIGVLTNIAHEHLDWHKSFENYAKAKLSLVAKSKIAIVNKDDKSFQMLVKTKPRSARIISYSLDDKSADFTLNSLQIKTNLPGDYNKQNALAAASCAHLLGIDKRTINKALTSFEGVIGRFEEIKNNRGFKIIVDFAHKPNALEALLKTLKAQANKRIIVVFGSAGLRDIEKRSMMGEIAGRFADVSIITAEDPRTEDVNDIIEQISKGFLKVGTNEYSPKKTKEKFFVRIPDRGEAIDYAINKVAKKGDIVAFLGKSHEKSMCIGLIEYPWNEYEAIYKALERK